MCKSGYKQMSGKFILMNTFLAKRMVTMLPRQGWWVGVGGATLCRIFLLIFGLKIKLIFCPWCVCGGFLPKSRRGKDELLTEVGHQNGEQEVTERSHILTRVQVTEWGK